MHTYAIQPAGRMRNIKNISSKPADRMRNFKSISSKPADRMQAIRMIRMIRFKTAQKGDVEA